MKNLMLILMLLALFLLNACGKADKSQYDQDFDIETVIAVNKGIVDVQTATNMCGIEIDSYDPSKMYYYLCLPIKGMASMNVTSEYGTDNIITARTDLYKITVKLQGGSWNSYKGEFYLKGSFTGGI